MAKLNEVQNTVRQHTQPRSPNRNDIQSPPDTSSGPRLSYLPALLLSALSGRTLQTLSLAGIYTYSTAMALDYGVKRVRNRVTGPETYPAIFWWPNLAQIRVETVLFLRSFAGKELLCICACRLDESLISKPTGAHLLWRSITVLFELFVIAVCVFVRFRIVGLSSGGWAVFRAKWKSVS